MDWSCEGSVRDDSGGVEDSSSSWELSEYERFCSFLGFFIKMVFPFIFF